MKIYQVIITSEAKDDLNSIYEYVAFDMENLIGATKIINAILNKCLRLSVMPKASYVRYILDGEKLRFTRIGKYTIIYYVDDKKSQVVIKSVIYSRRNLL